MLTAEICPPASLIPSFKNTYTHTHTSNEFCHLSGVYTVCYLSHQLGLGAIQVKLTANSRRPRENVIPPPHLGPVGLSFISIMYVVCQHALVDALHITDFSWTQIFLGFPRHISQLERAKQQELNSPVKMVAQVSDAAKPRFALKSSI